MEHGVRPDTAAGRRSISQRRMALVATVASLFCAVLLIRYAMPTLVPVPDAQAGPLSACETDLSEELEGLGVPGAAAVIVKEGRVVCATAAGMANIAEDRSVSQDTLFLIASVSKTVTVTALMQLYERGEFELGDDINDYLPFDIRIPDEPGEPITFRHLLTHTASLRDNNPILNALVTAGADSPVPLAELTEAYFSEDGDYYDGSENFIAEPPGTEFRYANMGIVLAGHLVEEISGVPFDEYCEENIFEPLGMSATSWRLADIDLSDLAMPYNGTWFGYDPYGQYGQANYPDGMLRTSAVELARILIAYMQGGSYGSARILSESTVNLILSRQTALNDAQGLVWFRMSLDDRLLWGHDGSDDGASAAMWFDPEEDVGVIMMANGNWSDEDTVFKKLFEEADDY